MKKLIIVIILLLTPLFASASIDHDLYYGLRNNKEVKELQKYLADKGFYAGNVTGNFFSITLAAVKKYQKIIKLNGTGYVGKLTRASINNDLLKNPITPQTACLPKWQCGNWSDCINSLQTKTCTDSNNCGTLTGRPSLTQSCTILPLTGSLSISESASYKDQTLVAPQTNLKLADFTLANNTSELINLNKIQIDLATGSNLYITNLYVTNLYVVYGGNKTASLGTVSHNNYLLIDFQLPVGQTIDLSVYGDVNSSIPLNSIINSSVLVTGVMAVSVVTVNTNSNAVLSGQNITFGTGSLTVSQDSSTPPLKIVAANQRVVAGKFQFKATSDSYTISELKFVIPDPRATSIISGAVLSDTTTQALLTLKPIPATYDGNDYIFDFNGLNIPVPLNSSKSLTFYYDLSTAVYLGSTNINIAPILAYVKATNSRGTLVDGAASNYSNNIIASYSGIVLPVGGVKVNNIYVFKSIPTFTAASSNTSASNGSNINLYIFSIGADPNGDVSVKQLMFTITITDPNKSYPYLNNFTFFKGSTDYTSSVAIAHTVNNNYIGLTSNNGIGIGTNTVVVTFNREETIPAGKTQTYTLKAYVNNFVKSSTSGSDSVSTSIPSDASISNNGSYLRMVFTNIYGLSRTPTDISVVNYNLLWSDKSASVFPTHSDLNGYSTADWYDGFKVLNLPLPTQTIIAK